MPTVQRLSRPAAALSRSAADESEPLRWPRDRPGPHRWSAPSRCRGRSFSRLKLPRWPTPPICPGPNHPAFDDDPIRFRAKGKRDGFVHPDGHVESHRVGAWRGAHPRPTVSHRQPAFPSSRRVGQVSGGFDTERFAGLALKCKRGGAGRARGVRYEGVSRDHKRVTSWLLRSGFPGVRLSGGRSLDGRWHDLHPSGATTDGDEGVGSLWSGLLRWENRQPI